MTPMGGETLRSLSICVWMDWAMLIVEHDYDDTCKGSYAHGGRALQRYAWSLP
jgi:hypothetical protein